MACKAQNELIIKLPEELTLEKEQFIVESIIKSFSEGGELYKALKSGGPSHGSLSSKQVEEKIKNARLDADVIADNMMERLHEVREAWDSANSLAFLANRNAREAETKERINSDLDTVLKPLVRQSRTALRNSYKAMFLAGKRAGGNMTPLTHDESEWVIHLQRTKQQFWLNFLRDIREGAGKMDYERRAELYRQDLYSAFWAGWVFSDLSSDRYVQWERTANESCPSCMALSTGGKWSNGIYRAQELAKRGVFPSSGSLICRTNCECNLKAVSKPSGRILAPSATIEDALPRSKDTPESFKGPERTERDKMIGLVKRYGSKQWKRRKATPPKKTSVRKLVKR